MATKIKTRFAARLANTRRKREWEERKKKPIVTLPIKLIEFVAGGFTGVTRCSGFETGRIGGLS